MYSFAYRIPTQFWIVAREIHTLRTFHVNSDPRRMTPLGVSLLAPASLLPTPAELTRRPPLSPSSGGLAGRSGGERGGRPPCKACSLGFVSSFGSMPSRSCAPTFLGDAGRRREPLPLRRPWWAAGRASSGQSSSNKLIPCARSWPPARDLAPSLRTRHGDGIDGGCFDLDSGDPNPWWRPLQQACLPPSLGRGGRAGAWLGRLPPLLSARLWFLLFLLAGRGGEEQERESFFSGGLRFLRGFPSVVLFPLALPHGASRPPRLVSDKPLRWGFVAETILVKGTSNKCVVAVPFVCRTDELTRLVLCGSSRRCGQHPIGSSWVLLLLLAGLGGEGEVEECLVLLMRWCWPGTFSELIIADAFNASVILCRQGGISSTSMMEAFSRHCRGCSNSLRGEVIRSPHRREGPRWMSVVGRGLPSSWSLLLGGDASRTPAKGGDDAQGPVCFLSLCSRVFSVKEMALSVGWAFPRAPLLQCCFCNLYSPHDQ
jgi:hypothetical protein